MATTDTAGSSFIDAGTRTFWRANIALFSAAFATFAMLYCVQPLLPVLAERFRVTPTASSLALSIPTAALGIGIILASSISEVSGRKHIMCWSLVIAAALTLASAVATTWPEFLIARGLAGLALSGLPAVAMAYVSEEFNPKAGGLAMGLYIGGTGVGGMTGRLVAAFLSDVGSWRWALGAIGGISLILGVLFWLLLPSSRQFRPHEPSLRELVATGVGHLKDSGLLRLYVMGFLLMGSQVSLFNYITFRLMARPYLLSQTVVGLIFLVYVAGVGSSAWAGNLAGRGSRNVLWITTAIMLGGVGISLSRPLWMVIASLAVICFGFFGAHTVASAWIGRRAKEGKALASSLYLFFYYAGASILGTTTGKAWTGAGWAGVAAAIGVTLAIGVVVSVRLRRLPGLQLSSAG